MHELTDNELLKLASKAAGYADYADGLVKDKFSDSWVEWNPLIDDGDALRIAVKLNMDLMLSPNHGKWAKIIYGTRADESGFPETNPYFATRRAIVRAAAAIGKAMP